MNLPSWLRRKKELKPINRVDVAKKSSVNSLKNAPDSDLLPVEVGYNSGVKISKIIVWVVILTSIIIASVSAFGLVDRFKQYVAQIKNEAGGLIVSSEYTQTHVLLDGKLLGQTPFTGENIPAGKHEVTIKVVENINNYFVESKFNIEITAGNTTVIKVLPAPRQDMVSYAIITSKNKLWNEDMLVITGTPTDAEVTIDNVPVGQVPLSRSSFLEGAHSVKLSKNGYKDMEVDISLHPNVSVTVDFRLYKYELMLSE